MDPRIVRECPECGEMLRSFNRSAYHKKCYAKAYHRARKTGDPQNRGMGGPTEERVAEAKRMRAAFKTFDEIGRHFGIARNTARNWCNQ